MRESYLFNLVRFFTILFEQRLSRVVSKLCRQLERFITEISDFQKRKWISEAKFAQVLEFPRVRSEDVPKYSVQGTKKLYGSI